MRFINHLGLSLLVWAACASSGCNTRGRVDALDVEAGRMLERRMELSLGMAPHEQPGVVGAVTRDLEAKPSADAYAEVPGTRNPSHQELTPLKSGAADDDAEANAERSELPKMLPDADQSVTLDLRGILQYAIGHSPEYRQAKENLYLVTLGLIIERHLWGPRFFNTVTARVNGTPESGDFDTALSVVNDFSVTHRLPYGGSVSASALVDYVNLIRESSTNTSPEETQDFELRLGFDLPLLRGAGQVARESRIQAERNLVYATRDFERFRREFFVSLASTYFDLLLQQEGLENRRRQVESLEALAARFTALAEAGREPQFEAERAEQQVLFGRNNLLNAQKRYADALDSLKLRLGMPMDQPLAIDAAEIVVPEPTLNENASVEAAWAYRLDLQTRSDRVEDADRDVAIAKNGMLPDLDLFGGINVPSDVDKDRGGVDLSLEDGSYNVGARFDAPLDRRIELAEYRRSLIQYERAERAFQVDKDRVTREVREAVREIEQARFSLVLQNRNVEIAKRRVIGVQLRERTLGPRDVIEAEEDLLDARNARDTAVSRLRQSVLRYLLDSGQMRVDTLGRWLPPGQMVPTLDGDTHLLPEDALAPDATAADPTPPRNPKPPAT